MYEETNKNAKVYKNTRDFASFLKNFDLINKIERNITRSVNAVPIISINDSEVNVYKGPALNERASAIPRIMILKTQLPRISP